MGAEMPEPLVAIVMAGGEGRRMAVTHAATPKPLVRIAGLPLLEIVLRQIRAAGIREIRVAVRNGARAVVDFLDRRPPEPGIRILPLPETEPLGTIGAVFRLQDLDRTILAVNADLLSGVDLSRMIAHHFREQAALTIATHDEVHRLHLGEVGVEPGGRVVAYREKPVKTFRISSGTYLLEPSVLALFAEGTRLGFPDLARAALERGVKVVEYFHTDPWIDVNDDADLREATRMLREDPAAFGIDPADVGAEARPGAWLGVDLGGTKVLGVTVSHDLRILESSRVPTEREEGPSAVVERVAGMCRSLLARSPRPSAVGVGFAGLVHPASGRVRSSVILPGWNDFPLADTLSEALGGLPVLVENDATAAGYGELLALGSPRGLNMVLLTLGTGIGGAIVIDGRLYRGSTGLAGEFGNTTIEWQGRECWCGNRGCLNTLASGSALASRAAEIAGEVHGVEEIRAAAREGNAVAAGILEEGARALGAGVANLINAFNPDRVVLAGGMSDLGEDWMRCVREEAGRRAFREAWAHARIEPSVVGPEVGAVGAAALVRDRFAGGTVS